MPPGGEGEYQLKRIRGLLSPFKRTAYFTERMCPFERPITISPYLWVDLSPKS